jgi:hypothetical protein
MLLTASLAALAPVVASFAGDADAERAILELQRFYRENTVCERVSIEVRTPLLPPATGTKVTRSSMNVTLKPSDPIHQDEKPPQQSDGAAAKPVDLRYPAALGLELRDLRIWVADRTLIAAHARDSAGYAEHTLIGADPGPGWLTSQAIGKILPPLHVAQLDFAAAAPTTPLSDLYPYATNIQWTQSEADPKQPHRRTIRGDFPAGTVIITTALGRLRSITINRPGDSFTLDMAFSFVGSCDPAKAMIDTTRRSRLPSLGDLRPRSGSLRIGARSPDLALSKGIGAGIRWSMDDVLSPPVEAQLAGVPAAEHAVLVFIRQVANPIAGAEAPDKSAWNLDLARFGRLMSQMRHDAFMSSAKNPQQPSDIVMPMARFGVAPVLVMAPPTADELIRRLREATELWGQDVLWTTDARGSIDLFAPGADVAAVVLDAEMVLRAVVVIDPKLSAEQAADQVAAALFEVAPQQAPVNPAKP